MAAATSSTIPSSTSTAAKALTAGHRPQWRPAPASRSPHLAASPPEGYCSASPAPFALLPGSTGQPHCRPARHRSAPYPRHLSKSRQRAISRAACLGPQAAPLSFITGPVRGCRPRTASRSGCGGVSDLAELGAQLVGTCALPVVGDAHPPGSDVDGDLFDAGVAGEVAFNVLFAFAAGDIGHGQLDDGLVHLLAPVAAGAAAAAGVGDGVTALLSVVRKRRNRSALPTTVTELVAIATAARTGGRIPAAASGTSSRLYPKAQPRFWRMMRRVARARVTASATAPTPPWTRVMSAATIAAPVPLATAMPMSAAARAGASLIPSPTI